ncbi:MAG: four-carbon acid sugar kinase family protein [Ilumatobacteraceae bacterium]
MQGDWLVAADDRTGALETAAELAGPGRPVRVTVGVAHLDAVVDLGTRAGDAEAADAAVRALPHARWVAHKIDSTLRGHWPAELAGRGRTLMVPAWPAMGRTCTDGVVHVHGAPVAAVRDRLPAAMLLPGVDALDAWLVAGDGIAAVDVPDTATLHAVAAAVARHAAANGDDLLLAGPAGAVGALHLARFGGSPAPPPPVDVASAGPALVVCGSATEVSVEQVRRLRAARPDVDVGIAPPADGPLDPAVAAGLAADVRHRWSHLAVAVLIGGDTAAAVLGTAPRLVGGHAAPGMPWSLDEHGGGPLVVTKAGGFGGPDALVDLFTSHTV